MDTHNDRKFFFLNLMSNNYTTDLIDNSYTIEGCFLFKKKIEKECVEIDTIESELIKSFY